MKQDALSLQGYDLPLLTVNTVVIGSGAAGYNAAYQLAKNGQKDVVVISEDVDCGTSRNAGSDKQTYYKVTQAGELEDSVDKMAAALMSGGCVDGDIALCEAALSTRCFYNLVELGVRFPATRYGEYVGYKTDHDPCSRGTSIGPYTSREMTRALEKAVKDAGVPVLSDLLCVRILRDGERCRGILCVNRRDDAKNRYLVIRSAHVILATGGPAGIYADSVYPLGQVGASGLAFEAGVAGKNLTEWQFGLASVAPRWNVSGTYMQVVPRFISTAPDGSDEREFLWEYLDEKDIWEKVFLKGYQWPFDVNKIENGSSLIDILVHIETKQKGRRVFLDFRDNPHGRLPAPEELPEICRAYLESTNALTGTPITRLTIMNQPAIDFYLDKGVDLRREPLEIALCAQHNNGGISADLWWQTELPGLFVVGEACGSHGVYRPGGSALNAGQVGALRAAQYILHKGAPTPDTSEALPALCQQQILETLALGASCLGSENNIDAVWVETSRAMSKAAAIVRAPEDMVPLRDSVRERLTQFSQQIRIRGEKELPSLFQLRTVLIAQYVYLSAMCDYAATVGLSRGSAIYPHADGAKPFPYLPDRFRYKLDRGTNDHRIQELRLDRDWQAAVRWRPTRPLPQEDRVFENVWKSYRACDNVY